MSQLPVVKFNDVDEFCQELAKDTPDRHIVRMTYLFKPSSFSSHMRHVLVVATCAVTRPGASVQIVRLEKYIDDLWGAGDLDEQVMEKGHEVRTKLEGLCRQMNLDVRGGVVE